MQFLPYVSCYNANQSLNRPLIYKVLLLKKEIILKSITDGLYQHFFVFNTCIDYFANRLIENHNRLLSITRNDISVSKIVFVVVVVDL